MRRWAALALLLLWAAPGRAALSPSAKAKSDVQAYCARIAEAVAVRELKPRFYVDLSDGIQEEPRWLEFKNQAAIDTACKERGCFQTAWLYERKGKLVLAAFTFGSPSGDWANNVDYYFHPNGKIAKNRSEYRRFGAQDPLDKNAESFLVEVLRTRYFTAKGKALAEDEAQYFNVKDNAKKLINKPDFMDGYWPQYKSSAEVLKVLALKKKP